MLYVLKAAKCAEISTVSRFVNLLMLLLHLFILNGAENPYELFGW